jgi:hypothetical protein
LNWAFAAADCRALRVKPAEESSTAVVNCAVTGREITNSGSQSIVGTGQRTGLGLDGIGQRGPHPGPLRADRERGKCAMHSDVER